MDTIKSLITALTLVVSMQALATSPVRAVEAQPAAAKKIKMKMDLSMDGRLVASQEILSQLNGLATVTQKNETGKELVVEVNPSPATVQGREGVRMKFRLGQRETDSTGQVSQVKWFASPEITALNRQEAEITVDTASAADGRRQYKLKVLPVLQ